MELLQHFTHNHPLILCDKGKYGGQKGKNARDLFCRICCKLISDPTAYICNSCYFVLHKSCAELPRKIISSLHPRHPLTPETPPPLPIECDHCSHLICSIAYCCFPCKVGLHSECTSQHIFQPKGHEHSFLLLRPTVYTCDACGEQTSGVSYLCTTCQLQVHKNKACTSFPLTVKQKGHHHPLKLTYSFQLDDSLDQVCKIYSFQLDDSLDQVCKICNRKMETEFCFYYCVSCTYFAHAKCATLANPRKKSAASEDDSKDKDENEDEDKDKDEVEDGSKFSLTNDVDNEISSGENHMVNVLKHFSHEHDLTLGNQEPENDEVCEACIQPILVPFYSCQQCNYFLHNSCAKLPKSILSPLHSYELTLIAKPTQQGPDNLLCYACGLYCNGFQYKCAGCLFTIDVRCGTYPKSLRHKGHEHTLYLIPGKERILNCELERDDTKCSACGLGCHARFRCEDCDFNLDLGCASLPYTVKHNCRKHKWNVHPLYLSFGSVEDESGQYYCDICEEQRGQNDWFYHCKGCDDQYHPSCILGRRHNIKSGKSTFKHVGHNHDLTLIEKVKGHPLCFVCGFPCEHLVLQCAQCNFNIHKHHYQHHDTRPVLYRMYKGLA